jgi:hypothetical protein
VAGPLAEARQRLRLAARPGHPARATCPTGAPARRVPVLAAGPGLAGRPRRARARPRRGAGLLPPGPGTPPTRPGRTLRPPRAASSATQSTCGWTASPGCRAASCSLLPSATTGPSRIPCSGLPAACWPCPSTASAPTGRTGAGPGPRDRHRAARPPAHPLQPAEAAPGAGAPPGLVPPELRQAHDHRALLRRGQALLRARHPLSPRRGGRAASGHPDLLRDPGRRAGRSPGRRPRPAALAHARARSLPAHRPHARIDAAVSR